MKALLRRYLRHLEDERNLSPNTLRAYRRDLERINTERAKLGFSPLELNQETGPGHLPFLLQ